MEGLNLGSQQYTGSILLDEIFYTQVPYSQQYLIGVMLFDACNARKLRQRNRRQHRCLLIQSLQEGGMGCGMCVKTTALQALQ